MIKNSTLALLITFLISGFGLAETSSDNFTRVKKEFDSSLSRIPVASEITKRSPIMAYEGQCFYVTSQQKKEAILAAFADGSGVKFYTFLRDQASVNYPKGIIFDQPAHPQQMDGYLRLKKAVLGAAANELVTSDLSSSNFYHLKQLGTRWLLLWEHSEKNAKVQEKRYCEFETPIIYKASEVWLVSEKSWVGKGQMRQYAGYWDRETNQWVPGQGSYEYFSVRPRLRPRMEDCHGGCPRGYECVGGYGCLKSGF